MFDNVRIVMVATSHPGNIGAAARAMKTMGLSRLVLVAPRHFPHPEALAMASGADDLLANVEVVETLEAALAGCTLVLAASARTRSLSLPVADPRAAAGEAVREVANGGEVALVFGRERSGLSNEELAYCQLLVHIPVNPDYSSLNVAAAVQVLCYELRMKHEEGGGDVHQPLDKGDAYATADELEGYYAHLERVLVWVDFLDPAQPGRMMPRLRRLYGRARPTRNELNILRGILSAVESGRRRLPDGRLVRMDEEGDADGAAG